MISGSVLLTQMRETASFLQDRGMHHVDLGIILGSGLSAVAEMLDVSIEIPYAEIPHLSIAGAPGHKGVLYFGTLGGKSVLVFSGRLHYYEGLSMQRLTYPVRMLQAMKAGGLLITAAVGGLSDAVAAGDIVLVRDHINLMPDHPLRGIAEPDLGGRFPEMSGVYDRAWNARIEEQAAAAGICLKRGVYVAVQGPSLETQAECQMLRGMGADVVGMSVVPEAIVAVQAGIRTAAIGIVANMAWHPERISGDGEEEILARVQRSGSSAVRLAGIAVRTC